MSAYPAADFYDQDMVERLKSGVCRNLSIGRTGGHLRRDAPLTARGHRAARRAALASLRLGGLPRWSVTVTRTPTAGRLRSAVSKTRCHRDLGGRVG